LALALVLAALGPLTVLYWPVVVEGYSLLALRVGFWDGRQRAAVRLARMGSVRAVRVLLEVSTYLSG